MWLNLNQVKGTLSEDTIRNFLKQLGKSTHVFLTSREWRH